MVQEVSRPTTRVKTPTSELIDSVVQTAATGKAVNISLDGQPYMHVQAKLRYACMKRGYKMSYQQNTDDTITVWCEKI